MDYYRRYVGDYRRDTARLTIMEHGAYGLLMDEAYASEKPLPAQYDELYRICGAITQDEQAAVRSVADRFFPLVGGSRHHKRIAAELVKGLAAIAAYADGAGKTNEKRWGKRSPSESPSESPGDPSTIHHPPSTKNHPPAVKPPPKSKPSSARGKRGAAPNPALDESARLTWESYRGAYLERWGAEPVRSAKANSLIRQFCQALPLDHAPRVAAFFVQSKRGLYTASHHDLTLLLRDAAGLHTEWATKVQLTETEARQGDRRGATGNAFAEMLAEAEERERIAGGGNVH